MDTPDLTERFVRLASVDNKAIMLYYGKVIVPLLLRHLDPGQPLLDLGCAGGVLLTLLKRRGFSDLHGIDAARVLLDRIPDKTIPVVCADYLRVNEHFPPNSFGSATVFNTLHHLDSVGEFARFFENLHRIMKPGSLVCVKELRNGMFYRLYNGVIHSRVSRWLCPATFGGRDYVQSHEVEMHRRFFQEFLPRFREILKAGGRFCLVARHLPLSFEQLFILRVVKPPIPASGTAPKH